LTEEQQTPSASSEGGTPVLQKYVRTLLDWGLVRKAITTEGTRYEITQTGSEFLREFGGLRSGTSELPLKLDQTLFGSVLQQVVKEQVTVVLPVLDEAEAIVSVIEEVKSQGYRNILILDGYSKDTTAEIARSTGATVIYQHGAGKAGAVKTAIENVETPYMLFMDGDSTYDPKDIWRLLNHNHRYAHVIGARDRKHIPRLHRLGNWVISEAFSLLFGVKASDVCSGMYLLESKQVRKYNLQEPGFVAEIELAAQSASTDNLTEVPISYRPRIGQRKLSTWRHGIAILSAAFALARRYNPILLYSSLASVLIFPAAVILGWVALEELTRHVWHYGLVLVGMLFLLVGVQAFTLASFSILTKHVEKRVTNRIDAARATP
jgi:glycosyltransferase involved in cell wall biosynthesis